MSFPSIHPILVIGLSLVVAFAGCSSKRRSSPDSSDARPAPMTGAARAPDAGTAGWNDAGIEWHPPEAGLAEARRENKPVCLVVFTTWCPRCTAYSKLFHDPRLVEAAKGFIMIRVDAEQDEAFAARYAPDGDYIPRTFFLSPEGKLRAEVRTDRDRYAYFYDDEDPAPLLAAMRRAGR